MSVPAVNLKHLFFSLDDYARRTTDVDEVDASLCGELTEVEQYLMKSQELIKVRGKVRFFVDFLFQAWLG